MPIFDTIVLLIVLIGAFSGWRKGLVSQIASIVSLVVSSWVATNFSGVIASRIDAAPPYNAFAAMLILFLVTSVVIWLIFRRINSTVDEMKLSDFDHQVGALFGGAKGFIIATIIALMTIGFLPLNVETRSAMINQTKSGPVIAAIGHRIRPFVPDRAMTWVSSIFDRLDEIRPSDIPVGGGYQVNQNGFELPGQGGYVPPTLNPNYGQQAPTYGQSAPSKGPPNNGGFPPGYPNGQQPPIYQPPPQTSGGPNWRNTPNGRF